MAALDPGSASDPGICDDNFECDHFDILKLEGMAILPRSTALSAAYTLGNDRQPRKYGEDFSTPNSLQQRSHVSGESLGWYSVHRREGLLCKVRQTDMFEIWSALLSKRVVTVPSFTPKNHPLLTVIS